MTSFLSSPKIQIARDIAEGVNKHLLSTYYVPHTVLGTV